MQVSELSARSGVTVPTLKYYLREGLLMPGEPTSATRATYGEDHLERVRLIRALIDVGRLSLADAGRIIAAIDSDIESVSDLLGTAHSALPAPGLDEQESPEVAALVEELGWCVDPGSPARRSLTATLAATARAGVPVTPEALRRYARACEDVAAVDVDAVEGLSPSDMLMTVVVGTVMIDPVLSALRRLAQEHLSVQRFG